MLLGPAAGGGGRGSPSCDGCPAPGCGSPAVFADVCWTLLDLRRATARGASGGKELSLRAGGAVAGGHHSPAPTSSRTRYVGRPRIPADGGAVSLSLPVRDHRAGASDAAGGTLPRRP